MNTVWTLLYLVSVSQPVVLTQHATQAQCEATIPVLAARLNERAYSPNDPGVLNRITRAMICVESFARK